MGKIEVPQKVYGAIFFIVSFLAIAVFFTPLVLGLLVYFNAFDLGTQSATYLIGKFGLDESSTLFYSTKANYVYSLYRIIGLSILTFVPFSAYGLVIAVGSVLDFYGISFDDGESLAFLAMVVATITAIGMAIAYWVLIRQRVPGSYYSILTMAREPMNFGYKLLFKIFPIVSILIEGLAIMIGIWLVEVIGFDDIPIAYPFITLIGVALGGGLIALLYFAFVKILVFLASIAGSVFLIILVLSLFAPQERYYTDEYGKSRKYHETALHDVYFDEEDAKSWEDYDP